MRWLSICACIAVSVLLSSCLMKGPAERRAAELRSQIEQEIPSGSSVEDVERFLDKHGVKEYSYSAESRRLKGIVRGIWAGFPVEASIQVRFTFDESEQLQGSEVEIIYTGP